MNVRVKGLAREKDWYEKETKWKIKKKRKKRYKKLWENTIPLVDYRGILEVSYELVLKIRRKMRLITVNHFTQLPFSLIILGSRTIS
jgi:hypothetical protein